MPHLALSVVHGDVDNGRERPHKQRQLHEISHLGERDPRSTPLRHPQRNACPLILFIALQTYNVVAEQLVVQNLKYI